jgi:hypothetical protein
MTSSIDAEKQKKQAFNECSESRAMLTSPCFGTVKSMGCVSVEYRSENASNDPTLCSLWCDRGMPLPPVAFYFHPDRSSNLSVPADLFLGERGLINRLCHHFLKLKAKSYRPLQNASDGFDTTESPGYGTPGFPYANSLLTWVSCPAQYKKLWYITIEASPGYFVSPCNAALTTLRHFDQGVSVPSFLADISPSTYYELLPFMTRSSIIGLWNNDKAFSMTICTPKGNSPHSELLSIYPDRYDQDEHKSEATSDPLAPSIELYSSVDSVQHSEHNEDSAIHYSIPWAQGQELGFMFARSTIVLIFEDSADCDLLKQGKGPGHSFSVRPGQVVTPDQPLLCSK